MPVAELCGRCDPARLGAGGGMQHQRGSVAIAAQRRWWKLCV